MHHGIVGKRDDIHVCVFSVIVFHQFSVENQIASTRVHKQVLCFYVNSKFARIVEISANNCGLFMNFITLNAFIN